MSRVGFIGLGVMGKPMAANLLKAGHQLFLFGRYGAPPVLLEAGGIACRSGAEVANHADFVIIMVPDTPQVESVLFAQKGVAQGLSPGKMVIDMSTISPLATRLFAQRINDIGCEYLDAPVSGGELGAIAASLTIMIGGSAAAFEKAKSLFDVLGKRCTHVGSNGDGQIAKAANQMIVALTIEAVGEALLFASKAGADPAKVRQALMGGFASSRVLEVHGERMLKRSFDPGFRIELHQKDLTIALDTARQIGAAIPATALCQQLLTSCVALGGRGWDHSGLVRILEKMADFEIGQDVSTGAVRPDN